MNRVFFLVLLLVSALLPMATRGALDPAAPVALPPETVDARAIRAALAAQAAAWNRGDIGAYMAAGYWESDSLLFIGATGPTRGYTATLARYRQRYPDAARMGKLTFEVLEMRALSDTYYFVVGRWALKRAADAPSGSFTLLWAKKGGRWVIVADHSS